MSSIYHQSPFIVSLLKGFALNSLSQIPIKSVLESKNAIQASIQNPPDNSLLLHTEISSDNTVTSIESEIIPNLYKSKFEVYLILDKKRKIYRLFDNAYSLHELLGPHKSFYLLSIPKNTSVFVSYFSHMAELSGAEKSLMSQIKDLKNMRVLSHVVAPHKGTFTSNLSSLGVPLDIIPYSWWGDTKKPSIISLADSIKAVLAYKVELEKINPHIIYTNTLTIPWGALLASLLRKPHIWHVKEFGEKDHGFKFILPFIEIKKFILQFSDVVICNSKIVKKEFEDILFTCFKTLVKTLYYNIRITEAEANSDVSRIYRIPHSLRLIIVGEVFESKGQFEAISAVSDLNKRHISVELVILGKLNRESIYVKKLFNSIRTHHIQNVYFMDKEQNPYPYMRQADIVLMCSKMEAFGKVTVEGMLLGKLIVAANTGGTTEIIQDGKTGIFYKQGSSADLANRIEKIYHNKKMVDSIGSNARVYALKHFTQNSYIDSIYDLFQKYKYKKITSPNEILLLLSQIFLYYSNTSKKPHLVLKRVLNRLRNYDN